MPQTLKDNMYISDADTASIVFTSLKKQKRQNSIKEKNNLSWRAHGV